jgi:hypothetical protein
MVGLSPGTDEQAQRHHLPNAGRVGAPAGRQHLRTQRMFKAEGPLHGQEPP